MRKYRLVIVLCVLLLLLALIIVIYPRILRPTNKIEQEFNSQRAIGDVEYQLALGPRTVSSQAHEKAVDWMVQQLQTAGWEVDVQEGTMDGQPIRNIVAKWGVGSPWIILGAHYDSRLVADHDPRLDYRTTSVPGANDGASGVAVLLELARVLPGRINAQSRYQQVWLVLFDAEDNGKLPGWDWILGSRYFAANLTQSPNAVVVLDMIGDANLNIKQLSNSDKRLNAEIWSIAKKLGFETEFIPLIGYTIQDDHTPFLERGIPAADIIDFDYPYWHTTSDTLDKVSPASLKIVGDVMLEWLAGQKN
jgi:glutaminyl-peptide cyclotransferase